MAITLAFVGIVKSSGATTGGSEVPDQTNAQYILDFVATLSGSYTAGGDPLDFTSAAPSGYQLPSVAPSDVHIMELAVIGTAATGFQYGYAYGPTLAAPTPQGGALQIFGGATASQDGLNEIPASAYSGQTPALNTTKLRIRATFSKSA